MAKVQDQEVGKRGIPHQHSSLQWSRVPYRLYLWPVKQLGLMGGEVRKVGLASAEGAPLILLGKTATQRGLITLGDTKVGWGSSTVYIFIKLM